VETISVQVVEAAAADLAVQMGTAVREG
jgi:hypothetical protein